MTESTPLITIGIPTYNRANSYLKQAIDSALNQTYQNIEIIVADNCSIDNTEALVGSFSDPRIRYHRHQMNIGPNNNFNFCLEQATGDYFLLFQDDDAIDEDFIESCMRGANYVTDLGIIRTGTRVIDSGGNVLLQCPNMVKNLPFEDFLLGWFRHKTAWYLCSTLFNTEKLREIGGFQSKHQLLQDGMAIAQLAAKYDRADVEEIKASFRKHGNAITLAVDVKDFGGGSSVGKKLEMCGIIANMNLLPGDDPKKPKNPSGLRIGVQELTRTGMKESEMKIIAEMINRIIENYNDDSELSKIKKEVMELTKQFPLYPELNY